MNARVAIADERTLSGAAQTGTVCNQAITPRRAHDRSQVGAIQFDSGYLSPHFVTHPERMEVAFENVYILIYEQKISSKQDLLPLLEQITKTGRPLLIIAEDVGDEALATLVVHKLCGPLQVAAVKAPGVGNERKTMLHDLALLTGVKAFNEGIGLQLKKHAYLRPR